MSEDNKMVSTGDGTGNVENIADTSSLRSIPMGNNRRTFGRNNVISEKNNRIHGESKWYVAHTYSGYENKVATDLEKAIVNQNLGDMIQQVKVPTETVVELKDGEEREVEKKIFPGYVFVKMVLNDASWYIVRNVRGCTGFAGTSTKPIPLTDKEVEKLGIEVKTIKLSYDVGESVRIMQGPLKNMVGRVSDINTKDKLVTIVVSMFGRETPVEMELNQIEPIN